MPIQGLAVLLRPCMSDLDNRSRLHDSHYPFRRQSLVLSRASVRAGFSRRCRCTEQRLFAMRLLCGLRGCTGVSFKRDESWQMNHMACARLGARAVHLAHERKPWLKPRVWPP